MTKKEKILMVAVLLFIGTLFFPNFPVLTVITSVFFLFTCFLFNPVKEKKELLIERKFIWWMLLFFILVVISLLLSHNKHAASRYLDSRLPLLVIPLSLGLVYIKKEAKQKILLGIALVITLSCSVCLVWAITRCIKFNDSSLLYNDSFTALTGQQSIYISLLVNISIYIFSFFLFIKKASSLPQRLLLISGIFYLCGINYLLASRSMMLVLFLAALFLCCWYIFKQKKYIQGLAVLACLAAGLFVIFIFFPKTLNRFKELAYTHFNYAHTGPESHYNSVVTADQWNGLNFRLAAWQCGWELFRQHPIMGTGIGDKKDRLIETYRAKNFNFAIDTGKNVHNNYLDVLMSMGLPGLIVFVIAWLISPFVTCWRRSDGLSMIIIFTFAIAMITEVYLDRSLGGTLLGLFVVLHLVDKRKNKNVAQ